MPNRWSEKPCFRCGGRKGAKYASNKYCGNCARVISKEASANAHGRALERRYGITRETYWELHAFQGGYCFICRRATGKTRRLTVDHNHKTGEVRGLLCRPCNTMLGLFRDDPAAFQRAIDYLTEPPFRAMLEGKGAINGA